jgi:hypothetical protein
MLNAKSIPLKTENDIAIIDINNGIIIKIYFLVFSKKE